MTVDLTGAVAYDIAGFAIQALHQEAALYPKPGLVSPVDAGSHRDMDYALFLASIESLGGYFRDIAEAGMQQAPFASLRALGMQAERDMLQATQGVNTHRGAIFNVGLLCAAAGWLQSENVMPTPENLGSVILEEWRDDIMQRSFGKVRSHGEQVEVQYGIRGARREAALGYPTALRYGLPAYRAILQRKGSADAAAVQALFAIMQYVDDTNILWRAGPDGLAFVKQSAAAFLDAGGVLAPDWREKAVAIHRQFVLRRLSPGGAADLLGATLFMHAACV